MELCNKIAIGIGVSPYLLYDDYLSFVDRDYGRKIKEIRKKNKMTQEKFGQSLKVHRKTVLRWEKSKLKPTRKHYLILKEYL